MRAHPLHPAGGVNIDPGVGERQVVLMECTDPIVAPDAKRLLRSGQIQTGVRSGCLQTFHVIGEEIELRPATVDREGGERQEIDALLAEMFQQTAS